MASTLMETCENARSYWLGPFSPFYQVTDVLVQVLKRVSEMGKNSIYTEG